MQKNMQKLIKLVKNLRKGAKKHTKSCKNLLKNVKNPLKMLKNHVKMLKKSRWCSFPALLMGISSFLLKITVFMQEKPCSGQAVTLEKSAPKVLFFKNGVNLEP
jgi:hypothetical protein